MFSARLWLMLAATTGIQTLVTYTALTIAAIAPEVAAGLGAPAELVGYQISLLYLGATCMSAIAGWQLRRWGPIRISQASLFFCVVGAALASVPWIGAVAAGSLVMGLGYGMTNPGSSQILGRIAPPGKRNMVFSIKQTGVPLGGVLAGLLAPRLEHALGWQAALLVAAGASLMMALAIQPLRREWDADRVPGARLRENPFAGMSRVVSSGMLRWMAVDGFCYAAVQLCISTFTVTLLVAEAGYTVIEAGGVLAAVQVAGIAGRLFWGWAADRTRRGLSILVLDGVGCVVAAALVVRVDPGWDPVAVVALFMALGFNGLGWTGVFQAETVRHAPAEETGAVVGAMTVPNYAGVIVGPSVFSLLFLLTASYTDTFALVAGFALAGVICLALAARHAQPVIERRLPGEQDGTSRPRLR